MLGINISVSIFERIRIAGKRCAVVILFGRARNDGKGCFRLQHLEYAAEIFYFIVYRHVALSAVDAKLRFSVKVFAFSYLCLRSERRGIYTVPIYEFIRRFIRQEKLSAGKRCAVIILLGRARCDRNGALLYFKLAIKRRDIVVIRDILAAVAHSDIGKHALCRIVNVRAASLYRIFDNMRIPCKPQASFGNFYLCCVYGRAVVYFRGRFRVYRYWAGCDLKLAVNVRYLKIGRCILRALLYPHGACIRHLAYIGYRSLARIQKFLVCDLVVIRERARDDLAKSDHFVRKRVLLCIVLPGIRIRFDRYGARSDLKRAVNVFYFKVFTDI